MNPVDEKLMEKTTEKGQGKNREKKSEIRLQRDHCVAHRVHKKEEKRQKKVLNPGISGVYNTPPP